MFLQKQPNRWSCMPTAFAMVLGVKVEQFIKWIGHDGSEIMWPGMPEPYCRRGFHPQEFQKPCNKLDYVVIEIEASPKLQDPQNPTNFHQVFTSEQEKTRLDLAMRHQEGVVTGYYAASRKRHALAWSGTKFYDPSTAIETSKSDYVIEQFFGLVQIGL